jgi:hypothetical protein
MTARIALIAPSAALSSARRVNGTSLFLEAELEDQARQFAQFVLLFGSVGSSAVRGRLGTEPASGNPAITEEPKKKRFAVGVPL